SGHGESPAVRGLPALGQCVARFEVEDLAPQVGHVTGEVDRLRAVPPDQLLPLGKVREDRLTARLELLDPLAQPLGRAFVHLRTVTLDEDVTPEADEFFRILPRVRLEELAFELRARSEEHTSELQSRENTVCRLLPENK